LIFFAIKTKPLDNPDNIDKSEVNKKVNTEINGYTIVNMTIHIFWPRVAGTLGFGIEQILGLRLANGLGM
jgi:hypothetical protein